MRQLLALVIIALITAFLLLKLLQEKMTRPNIVLGYGDLSCYGATQYQMPNLDWLLPEPNWVEWCFVSTFAYRLKS